MLGRGDWQKLQDRINGVLEPLGARVAALEEQLEALKGSQKAPEKPQTQKGAGAKESS